MLDRASIERLCRTPEKNAPMLNVALAEEGAVAVLLALAASPAVGPEALAVIAGRIAREGAEVGREPEAPRDEEVASPVEALDRLLLAHLRSPDAVRDAALGRHAAEAFFVLAAACHPRATLSAVELAVDWPSASAAHDRLWLGILDPAAVPPLTLEEWAQEGSGLRREAAARLSRDAGVLGRLARDPARQVRRAVASNRFAREERARLAVDDPAPDIRARAAGALSAHGETAEGTTTLETARFAAALRAMATGGVLAPDVRAALSGNAAALDCEGALLAGRVLPRAELAALVEQMIDLDHTSERGASLAAGIALRPPCQPGEEEAEGEAEHAEIVYDAVKALARTKSESSWLTGKARLAAWAADGLVRVEGAAREQLAGDLARRPLAADRMILARCGALRPPMTRELCLAARGTSAVPPALLELAWGDPTVDDGLVAELAALVARPKKRAEDLLEDEVDLAPLARPLDVLERVVLLTTPRANVAPRAALAVVALDARRVRYVLSAMPQWKGRLTGGRLARVLRQHAGALVAAGAETRARASRVEAWTERVMSELEVGIALAVGHLTAAEVARRLAVGRQSVDDAETLAAGAEARAAVEGAAAVAPLLEWATKHRTSHAGALALWLLLERLDRERGSALIAASIDGLASGKAVVPKAVCDALAVLEHRRPGRLETVHPQSPRGRATLASAIALAYRALGGMREERLGP